MPSPIPRQDRWDCSLISHRRRPSLDSRRVGSCITRFGACTAFTIVTASKLAKSPTRPSTPEASAASLPPLLLRLLPGGANQFPGGILPAVDQRLFTAHAKVGLACGRTHGGRCRCRFSVRFLRFFSRLSRARLRRLLLRPRGAAQFLER